MRDLGLSSVGWRHIALIDAYPASEAPRAPTTRRVLQVEYAAEELPRRP